MEMSKENIEIIMKRRHHIACYTTGQRLRLKLASLLDFAQDMAGDHADILGFGNDLLLEHRIVWVLSRIKLKMDSYPLWREDMEISTWHRGLEGPLYIRDYRMADANGRQIGVMTTSWLLLNVDERRIVRSDVATDGDRICTDKAMDELATKVRLPKDIVMEDCGEHRVCYSDVDKNGHTNNVRYTVWALDALDRDFVTEHPVREYEINFVKEAMPDEVVRIRRGQAPCENGTLWYVEGYVGEHQSFICKILF